MHKALQTSRVFNTSKLRPRRYIPCQFHPHFLYLFRVVFPIEITQETDTERKTVKGDYFTLASEFVDWFVQDVPNFRVACCPCEPATGGSKYI